MSICVVTGSAGLIGSEATRHFAGLGYDVVGIDNDMRSYFFGETASTAWNRLRLEETVPRYRHHALDIRDRAGILRLFESLGCDIAAVIHAAAQPSHDWAAREPFTDFDINAVGTLNLLEATRRSCPEAVFLFTSTNKVYGDAPNSLPLIETDTRWMLDPAHPYASRGIPEEMSIDGSLHSLFGASKVAADVLVQEYGRYFGLKTGIFRGGCLTGPDHSGAPLHGFLAYLMRCAVSGEPYTIYGYKGKQVRDNIHSSDVIAAFSAFVRHPRAGAVYNIGGGMDANCSMQEAIALCEEISGRRLEHSYSDQARTGDHIWYVSDLSRLRTDYLDWRITRSIPDLLSEMHDALKRRLTAV